MIPIHTTCAALVLLAATASAQERIEKEAVERAEAYLENCAAFGWDGAALIARGDEVLLARGFGLADRETGRANDAQTLFEIASATKPFTAMAILKLEELGKLSIDDPIAKHLPDVPEDKQDITIAHLLTHGSGMPRSAVGGGGFVLEEAVRGYLATPRQRASGKAFEYWNGGYALLAGIVEVASGQGYMDFCREHLFEPGGMNATGFTGDELPEEQQAIGTKSGEPLRPAAGHPYGSYGYQYRGMGGMVTSANDLWRFTRALDAGEVLAHGTIARMQTPVLESQGLGWSVTRTDRGTRRVSHGGDVAGFHTQFQRYVDEDVVVIVLSNVDEVQVWPLAWNLEAMLFGAKAKYPTPPTAIEMGERALENFVGEFYLPEGEGSVRVIRDGAGLRIGLRGQDAIAALKPAAASKVPSRPFPRGTTIHRGLDEETALATAIVDAVVRKDADWIRERLLDGIPRSWPDTLVNRIWREHLDALGAHQESRVVAASKQGGDAVQVVLQLVHEQGERRLEVVTRGGKLNIFYLEPRDTAGTLEQDVDLARGVLNAVIEEEPDHVRSLLLEHIPPSWPDRLVGEYWPAHVKENGRLKDVRLIGASDLGGGRTEVLFLLEHKKRERGLRVILQGGKLSIFDLKGPVVASERLYLPTAPKVFTSYDWSPPFGSAEVRFDLRGRRMRAITLTGPDGEVTFER